MGASFVGVVASPGSMEAMDEESQLDYLPNIALLLTITSPSDQQQATSVQKRGECHWSSSRKLNPLCY